MKFSKATNEEILEFIFSHTKIVYDYDDNLPPLTIYKVNYNIFDKENYRLNIGHLIMNDVHIFNLEVLKIPEGYREETDRQAYELYLGPFLEPLNMKNLFQSYHWSSKFSTKQLGHSFVDKLSFQELKEILIDIEKCKKIKSFL